MTQVNPYITFGGNCREAMTFYKECLDAELNLQTIEGSPIEAQCPSAMKNQILHSSLTKGAILIMGSDMIGPEGFTMGNNIALSLNCSSDEEINSFFSKLSDGGHVFTPLQEMFWGATFGTFTDKFGIRWILNYDKNLATSTN